MSPSKPPRPRVPAQIWRRLLATVAAGALVAATLAAAPAAPAAAAGGPNLAAGRPISASSHTEVYVAANATDGDQSSYWESANHAFPQWLQVDLGGPASVDQLVLKLPPSGWEARTQTLAVLGSTSGSAFTTILPSGQYLFDPATGNTATIDFDPTETRFVRVEVTANTGWPAGQVSELEVYGTDGGGGDPGDPGDGSNLAVGDPITASSTVHTFVASNANDNDVTSYWEGAPGAYPSTLTVALGADAVVSQLVLKLNPDPIWGPRTQTLQVLGRGQGGGPFSTLVPSAGYAFHPATGNTVTIPVSATAADVRLQFTANTGAPNGQVAELQVIGVPAPNPDLVVEQLSWSPAAPVETDQLTCRPRSRTRATGRPERPPWTSPWPGRWWTPCRCPGWPPVPGAP